MLDELKDILNSLYCQYGATYDIVRLSQLLDRLINQEQQRKVLKMENMKYLEECYKRMSRGELIDIYED